MGGNASPKFPDYKTTSKMVATEKLVPYARNSRTHSPAQVDKIAASIREFGFLNPVIIDGENGIIAGHCRILAAHKLGLTEVPCVEASYLTPAQKRAYIIADNRLALDAGWDNEMLKIELMDLQGDGFNLELTGFSLDELAGFLDTNEGLTDPDDVPDAPAVAVTVEGDVWLLGRHRLMCGDSTSRGAVDKLMDGQKADLCFTSPPYAQQRDYKKEISDWDGLMNGVFSIAPVKDGAQILVNLGMVHEKCRVNTYWESWLDFMDANGWPLFGWYVWDQCHGMPGNWNGRLAPSHEFVFHFAKNASQSNKWQDKKPENIKAKTSKKGAFRQKDGSLKPIYSGQAYANQNKVADSVIRVNRAPSETAKMGHPATFPVGLCDYIYKSYTKVGDWIFEPFSGSGTSIIACEGLGLNCAAMELAPEYTDIAVIRWQNFTGQEATLESTGQTYAELKAERVAA